MEDAEEWVKRKQGFQEPAMPVRHERRMVKWNKPPVDWLKCNTDGAWPKEGETCGLGWVLRNHEGRVLWMGARALAKTRNVLEVEAEALRWAITSLIRLGYRKIIFESDSHTLVDLITERNKVTHVHPVIQDIKVLLQHMEDTRVVFSSREANRVADRAIREAVLCRHFDPNLFSVVSI